MIPVSRDELCEAAASIRDAIAALQAEGRGAPDLHRALALIERTLEREGEADA